MTIVGGLTLHKQLRKPPRVKGGRVGRPSRCLRRGAPTNTLLTDDEAWTQTRRGQSLVLALRPFQGAWIADYGPKSNGRF